MSTGGRGPACASPAPTSHGSAQGEPPYGRFVAGRTVRAFGLWPSFPTREGAIASGAEQFAGATFCTARVERPAFDFAAAAAEVAPLARLHLLEQLRGTDHEVDPRELAPPPGPGEDPRLLFALENLLASYFGPTGALRPRGWIPADLQAHRSPNP